MRKAEKPGIIFRKDARGAAVPLSSFDAEEWERLPRGSEFRMARLDKRSLPQLRTYWKALTDAIRACGWTMTADNLNAEIKEALGYVAPYRTMAGELRYSPDSIALNQMTPDEFQEFMDKAMALLAEHCGFDPLSFLAGKAAA